MTFSPPPPPPDDGAAALSSVLVEVRGVDAELASAEARRTRALARAGHLALDATAGMRASAKASEMALREVASEIAAAACVSDRSVQAQIGRAMTLADDFPVTLDAWEAGALSRAHVQAIVDAGTPLPLERRHEFDVLAVATAEGLSPGRLKARLAALAESLQPTTITERHRRGRETRCVRGRRATQQLGRLAGQRGRRRAAVDLVSKERRDPRNRQRHRRSTPCRTQHLDRQRGRYDAQLRGPVDPSARAAPRKGSLIPD